LAIPLGLPFRYLGIFERSRIYVKHFIGLEKNNPGVKRGKRRGYEVLHPAWGDRLQAHPWEMGGVSSIAGLKN
jgi:hypothetical protein